MNRRAPGRLPWPSLSNVVFQFYHLSFAFLLLDDNFLDLYQLHTFDMLTHHLRGVVATNIS